MTNLTPEEEKDFDDKFSVLYVMSTFPASELLQWISEHKKNWQRESVREYDEIVQAIEDEENGDFAIAYRIMRRQALAKFGIEEK